VSNAAIDAGTETSDFALSSGINYQISKKGI
jgi:hypothetical protein